MIDKLDVRIPAGTPFSPQLQPTIEELNRGIVAPFRPSRFYQYVGDLRKIFDIDAVLHLSFKYGDNTHKLEIIDAGKKSLSEMQRVISQVCDVDPSRLSIMRVDLAADVPGVPVHWFRDKARFQFKQFASRIEKAGDSELEFIAMGTAQAQSVYAGRRPNCVRIYDKIAEWYRQWSKMRREYSRRNRSMNKVKLTQEGRYYGELYIPSFEEWCEQEGFEYHKGAILTRVERQIGGDRIPPELTTVGHLGRAHEFNPFATLQIIGGEPVSSWSQPPDSVPIRNWLAALGFQTLRERFGNSQQAVSYVTKFGKGNGKRVLESVLPLLPQQRPAVTIAEILERYRRGTEKQVSENPNGPLYLGPSYDKESEITESSSGVLSGNGPEGRPQQGITFVPGAAQRTSEESGSSSLG